MKILKKRILPAARSPGTFHEVIEIERNLHLDPRVRSVVDNDKRETPAKILLISDQSKSRSVLRKELQAAHYDVISAENEAEGLNLAETIRPDLFILDMILSSRDGLKVCRRLKDHPATRAVPLIFIACWGEAEAINVGLDLGAVDYVLKPYRPMELRARIRKALMLGGKPQRFYDEGLWSKDIFIERVSNALRNHVTVIAGFAALLEQKMGRLTPSMQRAYLQEIIQHTDHLADLTDGFETLLHAKGMVEKVDLFRAVSSAVEAMRPMIEKKGRTLVLKSRQRVLLTGRGYNRDLIIAVRHLLSYVHRYTTPGGTIEVDIFSKDHQGRIEVITTGLAIALEGEDRISLAGETDLGLAIVQWVAEQMGGTIGIENHPARGHCFRLSLPLQTRG